MQELSLEELYALRRRTLSLIMVYELSLGYADGAAYYQDKDKIRELRDDLTVIELAISYKEPKQLSLFEEETQ